MSILEADDVLYSILALVIIENALEIYIAYRQVSHIQNAGTCQRSRRQLMFVYVFYKV